MNYRDIKQSISAGLFKVWELFKKIADSLYEFFTIIFVSHLPLVLLLIDNFQTKDSKLKSSEVIIGFYGSNEILGFLCAIAASIFYIYILKFFEVVQGKASKRIAFTILFFIIVPIFSIIFYSRINTNLMFGRDIDEEMTSKISIYFLLGALCLWLLSLICQRFIIIEAPEKSLDANADNITEEIEAN